VLPATREKVIPEAEKPGGEGTKRKGVAAGASKSMVVALGTARFHDDLSLKVVTAAPETLGQRRPTQRIEAGTIAHRRTAMIRPMDASLLSIYT
jgi:hypothetical protein